MKFEFRFESLKSISVLILFVYKLKIGSSKINRENYQRKYFRKKEKETGLSANRPLNNWALYFLAFPPLKDISEKFGQLPRKHCMFHALSQGLNLFFWWHSLWRHTHQTQTHRMSMQFPKYKLQRKPLLKTVNRTQPRCKAETMSNH